MVLREDGIRWVQFLGAGSSDYCDFIAADGDKAEVVRSVMDALFRRKDRWDRIRLRHVPDTSSTAMHLGALVMPSGWTRIQEIEAQARRMVAEGRGRELIVLPGWFWVVTAQSYLDYAYELPDVLELAPRITCPTLYIRGDQEPAHVYPAEEFAERAGGPCDVRIVKDCDHFYTGREDEVSSIVTGWLGDLLGKT